MKKTTIECNEPKKLDKERKQKWDKKMKLVRSESDKVAIILLGEIIEIIVGKPCEFSCSGKVDYDMFSGCDYAWELRSGKYAIGKQLSREISESWQRVEVEEDSFHIHGFESINLEWNGDAGGYLETLALSFQTIDDELIQGIVALCKRLYEKVKLNDEIITN